MDEQRMHHSGRRVERECLQEWLLVDAESKGLPLGLVLVLPVLLCLEIQIPSAASGFDSEGKREKFMFGWQENQKGNETPMPKIFCYYLYIHQKIELNE